ncbi:MAG: T9SS type A sorting domain-containing protein [Bacteroidetes bacterium]|nr:T9SS type A sorting domain-containing protein [Bacteroidota bacterium]
MKKIKAIIIALMISQASIAQWSKIECNTEDWLSSVFFTSPDTGYISNLYKNEIYKTVNGGLDWTVKHAGSAGIKSIRFLNQDIGFAVGNGGSILKTTDGGENWHQKISGTVQPLTSVFFISTDIGFVVGGSNYPESRVILKTIDGGEAWTILTENNEPRLMSCYFVDKNTGYAVGDNEAILKTTDGGKNWSNQKVPGDITQGGYRAVHFTSKDTGFVSGEWGYVFKTTNGGQTWRQINSKTWVYLDDIYFVDAHIGFAVGGWTGSNPTIINTLDGGENWSLMECPVLETQLYAVHFPSTNRGYITGLNGTVLRIDSNFVAVPIPDSVSVKKEYKLYPTAVKEILTIESPYQEGETTISIITINGEVFLNSKFTGAKTEINLSSLNKGLYFIKLSSGGEISFNKIYKE